MNPATSSIEQLLVLAGGLLLAAVAASKASSRLGVPALLVFLALGMLAGEDGPGGIPFEDAHLTQSLGVVALTLILFAGGLETRWATVRVLLWRGLSLATVGVLVTATLTGVFAAKVLHLSWLEGLLLGAIVSSTDAAAVFSVLRSQGASLKGGIQPLLELESGSNDPMAVFLTVALIRLLQNPGLSPWTLPGTFLVQMTLGLILGLGFGKGTAWLVNRIRLETEGLYPAITVAAGFLCYGVTAEVGGSGFLAVYVAGIVMGRDEFIHKRSLLRFHNGLAWIMQIVMFLTLGLLVFPSSLPPIALVSLLIAAFLVFVARPVSVFLGLSLSRNTTREKGMIAWVGLRGAVPIILATFPQIAGLPNARLFFDVVFFIVLTSVLVQGTTLAAVGRWLDVNLPGPARREPAMDFLPGGSASSDMIELIVAAESAVAGRQIVDLGLPHSALIVLLTRGESYVAPRGSTVLEANDVLMVLAEKSEQPQARALIEGNS
ncbi:MAG TPA: potassium/proton antiporter [Paludibaculum sp.]|jgi:cell volume regulation protein A